MATILFCFPLVRTIGKPRFWLVQTIFHINMGTVQASQKFYFPMVWTTGKQNKWSPVCQPLKNGTDPYHSNSQHGWYSNSHCNYVFFSIFSLNQLFHRTVEEFQHNSLFFEFNLTLLWASFKSVKFQQFFAKN